MFSALQENVKLSKEEKLTVQVHIFHGCSLFLHIKEFLLSISGSLVHHVISYFM